MCLEIDEKTRVIIIINNNITIFIQVSLFSNVHLLLSIKDLFT